MKTADYIKNKLNARVKESCIIPQRDGSDIIMDRCVVDDKYKIVIVYSDDDKVAITEW